MSELRKANTDYCYFITFTVVGWIDVFTRSRYSDVILESLAYCQENKGLEVFEFVIMPSHVHLIVRSPLFQIFRRASGTPAVPDVPKGIWNYR
jgi:putative transposase